MHDAAEMMQRHGRTLARLTELGLALAERTQAQAVAALDAEDPKAAAGITPSHGANQAQSRV